MEPIVIIGGGIIGASLAYHLRDHPRPVILYERDALGSGTSADSVALFVWHQSTPDRSSHKLRTRSWEQYEPLIQSGTISFEQIGTLDVTRDDDEAEALRDLTGSLQEFGAEASFLGPDALAEHGLNPDAVAGAMWTPEDGYLDPSEIIQHYIREATDSGATVETQTAVTDIITEEGRVTGVETEIGTQSAAVVVNAAGPWAPTVNEMVDVPQPFRHNRGPVVVLQKDESFGLPFIQFDDGLYFRSEGRNQAFAGNFGASYEDAELLNPSGARSVDHDFYLEIDDRIQEAIPRLEGVELANEWVGVRTLTPDGVPIVGETNVDDFFIAAGMNGLGVTLAPAVSEYLATIIKGGDVDDDVEAYLSPSRFA
ncbi:MULTISPECIES: FAD-binding oxidoreductase [Haloferax]|uniref:FAD-dependent oxidoreductase n=2 Tax=Haloferax TaxID=2251 RepID=A0A6G1Z692_9EURY|nr:MULTISPECIES: FAD-dependent oxidoreductase [Haloferax]KAB1185355.1 FAD-binding oxidoreductase [Haloferax sp. CBA1149]MRW81995.1 FAD-dependent oxidoreductase [Haloferax marinisediminis]